MTGFTQETLKNSEILDNKKSPSRRMGVVVLIVGIIIFIGVVVVLSLMVFSAKETSWQAVYVSNDQMYFGHIVKDNGKILVLKDVHYLQMQQIAATKEGEQPSQQLTVVKAGSEVYGPTGEMKINWDHILFTQKLKADSQVIEAINKLGK
ncbi:MAG: hypothetical protein PHE59_01015 [Patescibacteria group bacterium]|nr:hypothetical protein [Patescibacteria group bacterium]MDD5164515.1 hypothetical protein [Patescibacteria group bacterium]MDD5534165.1 hypothetical protein [Patescibacteria group bacterium]